MLPQFEYELKLFHSCELRLVHRTYIYSEADRKYRKIYKPEILSVIRMDINEDGYYSYEFNELQSKIQELNISYENVISVSMLFKVL